MRRLLLLCSVLAIAACQPQHPAPIAAAAPPPPPPPPPAPTSFNVYFDYNSAVLEPSGRQVVKFAADQYRTQNPGAVQVTGFTDARGSGRYNQRLSARRAGAVAAALQQEGVPRSMLTVSGQGESSTGASPGNDRRVEITFGGPPSGAPTPPPPPGPPPPAS